jgi:hypothetical protein
LLRIGSFPGGGFFRAGSKVVMNRRF